LVAFFYFSIINKNEKMKIITFLLLFSFFSTNTLLAQDFYLNSNGVTCMCPDAAFGDTGVVNEGLLIPY
tara:strand:+ start:957 stop:1163 length:207 start_codon:yes stop_codon:yes gene_type:complete